MLKNTHILEAKTVLLTAAESTGWNVESMLDVICDFVNSIHEEERLLVYVENIVAEELDDQELDELNELDEDLE